MLAWPSNPELSDSLSWANRRQPEQYLLWQPPGPLLPIPGCAPAGKPHPLPRAGKGWAQKGPAVGSYLTTKPCLATKEMQVQAAARELPGSSSGGWLCCREAGQADLSVESQAARRWWAATRTGCSRGRAWSQTRLGWTPWPPPPRSTPASGETWSGSSCRPPRSKAPCWMHPRRALLQAAKPVPASHRPGFTPQQRRPPAAQSRAAGGRGVLRRRRAAAAHGQRGVPCWRTRCPATSAARWTRRTGGARRRPSRTSRRCTGACPAWAGSLNRLSPQREPHRAEGEPRSAHAWQMGITILGTSSAPKVHLATAVGTCPKREHRVSDC